ncbi:hypothetical protein R9C00_10115 [Flammeovirgaceae bacterium SG7u.111]|nr:hypothetical protein [Flammeovirgaceae bacterium SG7u.132]WPO37807.1 hypothetical protein R9C00_10115 [Flammeovirgaceae bacterium SG7u.111]
MINSNEKNADAQPKKVSTTWRNTLAKELKDLVNVAESPTNMARAKEAGYTKGELETMISLAKQVMAMDIAWEQKQAQKAEHYGIFHQSLENLYKQYMVHLEKARRIFDPVVDKGISKLLKLKGDRPDGIDEKLDYIYKFYQFATSEKEISDRLKKRNIQPELVQQMLALTEEVRDNHIIAQRKEDEGKEHTQARNEQKGEFHKWLRTFKAIYKATPAPKVTTLAGTTTKTAKEKV